MKKIYYLLAFFFLCFLQKSEIKAQNCIAYAGEDTLVCGLQYQLVGNGYGNWTYSCDSDTIPPIDFTLVDDSTANVTASAYGLHQFIFTLYQNSCSSPANTDTVLVFFYPKITETGNGIQQNVEIQGVECPPDVMACIGQPIIPIIPASAGPNPIYTVSTTVDITTSYEQTEVIGNVTSCIADSIAISLESSSISDSSSTEIVWNGDNVDEVWDAISNGFGQALDGSLNGIEFPTLGDLDSLFCPNEDTITTVDIDSSYLLLPVVQTGAYWEAVPINDTPESVFAVVFPDEFAFNLDSILIIALDSTLISTSPDVWQVDSVGALGSFQYTWVETWEYDTLWIYSTSSSSCPDCHSGIGSGIDLPPPPPPCSFTITSKPPVESVEYWEICEWEEIVLPDGTIISGSSWGGSEQTHTIEDSENCTITEYIIYIMPNWSEFESAEICEGEVYTSWWTGDTFSESGTYFLSGDWCKEYWLDLMVLPVPSVLAFSTDASCGQANGSASIVVNGGEGPYTYSWNNSFVQNTATAINLPAGSYCIVVTDGNGCMTEVCVNINDIGGPTVVDISETDATCGLSNGSATVTVNGGLGSYSYQWDNGQVDALAIGLSAGTYCVTVTDENGCIATDCIELLEENENTETDISETHISGDGYELILANGDIYNEANPTGTSILSTMNGCDSLVNVILIFMPASDLEITGNIIDAFCGECNGEAFINVIGGTTPYSYLWNDTPSQNTPTRADLCAGTYCVTVTDVNGITAETCVTISETDAPIVDITKIDANCGQCDGTATAIANGGVAPYYYEWNDSFEQTTETATGLCPDTYCVSVTDANGCVVEACVTIVVLSAPMITSINSTDANCGQCNGEAFVNVDGGTTPYIYDWNNGQTTQTATNLCAGTHCVSVTDANGCFTEVSCIEIFEINENTETFISEEHCQGEGYNFTVANGDTYNEVNPIGTSTIWEGSANGCDSIINVNLTFHETSEQTENITICEGEEYLLPDGNNVSQSGEYITILQSENACDSIVTIILENINFLETPNAICAESTAESITIVWNSVESALAYVVSYENTSDTTIQTSYTITGLAAETNLDISVIAIGAENCNVSDIEIINCTSGENDGNIIIFDVPNIVVFPNAFSPNEDEQNDEFRAIGRNIKSVKMAIYNRWGEVVFENRTKTNENIGVWNGKFKNERCELGVYLFHATVTFIDESVEQHKGNITLLR